MAKTKQDLTWTNIDVSTLSEEHQTAFAVYKASYAETKALKEAFEKGMRRDADLPKPQMLFFGYNFGKLSLAIGIDDTTPKAAPSKAPSLAQFLANQSASGRTS